MLGKLIHYEFKTTARYFLPIYVVILFLTPITKLITSLDIFNGYLVIIPGFFITAYVISILSVAIITFVVVILRFYKNLIGDEGYLMHTLPVKPSDHIISKTTVSFIWNVTSLFIIILSLFVFFFLPDNIGQAKDLWNMVLQSIYADFGVTKFTFMTLLVLGILAIIGTVSNILYVYISIAIGQVINRNKIIGSVVAALVINMISQIISLIVTVPIILLVGANINDPSIILNWVFPLCIVYSVIITVGYYIGTNYVLKKKLNLE